MAEAYPPLAERLLELRKKHGYTQEDVAETAGMILHHYQRLETGRLKNPTPKTLERIARVYRIDPVELLIKQSRRTVFEANRLVVMAK